MVTGPIDTQVKTASHAKYKPYTRAKGGGIATRDGVYTFISIMPAVTFNSKHILVNCPLVLQ